MAAARLRPHRRPGGRGTGRGPPGRHRPPRRQAAEHPHRPAGACQGLRLRHRHRTRLDPGHARRVRSSAAPATCPPSRSAASRWTPARTSTRWAWSCTRCSPGIRRSTATTCPRSPASTSTGTPPPLTDARTDLPRGAREDRHALPREAPRRPLRVHGRAPRRAGRPRAVHASSGAERPLARGKQKRGADDERKHATFRRAGPRDDSGVAPREDTARHAGLAARPDCETQAKKRSSQARWQIAAAVAQRCS